MNSQHGWSRRALLAMAAAIFGLVLASSGLAAEITADNVGEHIAAAKTAADHEAIASYFRGQADKAGASAKSHKAMLAVYDRAGIKQHGTMTGHCRRLIASLQEQQKEYLEMAKLHDEMAKSAGK